ncbi:hypothetical protein BH09BAC4_BH09BAC4_49940 [soil metagenome]
METFTETQRFRQGWVWLIMGFSVLIFLGSLSTVDAWNKPIAWLSTMPLLLIVGLLYAWQLDTQLDSEGIHYRIFPIFPWRTIPWRVIQSTSVVQYSYVGYGIRWGFEGWVYNVAGDKGIRVLFDANRRITIGTQRSDEVQHFLDQLIVVRS